jgi:hypothetical protein
MSLYEQEVQFNNIFLAQMDLQIIPDCPGEGVVHGLFALQ